MKNKFIVIIFVLLSIVVLNQYNVKTVKANNNAIGQQEKIYKIDLQKFNIKNDGTAPVETSKGINDALQFSKQQGYTKVIFPNGIYLIDEKNPIILDMKNMIIDLNGSTFQINTNGLDKYSIVIFKEQAQNLRLTNGNIRGDKDTHDYKTIKSTHEWGCGIVFESGTDLEVDNIIISNLPGYGIGTETGIRNGKFLEVSTKNLELGSIDDNGLVSISSNNLRTKTPYNIGNLGIQFELGYVLGYQGYPVLKNKQYISYFYDKDMNFIEKKECIQFRKVNIPKNAVYVNFVFDQKDLPKDIVSGAWISNLKPPSDVKFHDNIIKENRSLGLAFCGGQKWIIENNLFEANGGNAPGYAVDFEDGWELMQDIIFKNNKFVGNSGDIVSCAGDNFIFEGNEFSSMVYIYGRTTNYKFLNNKFLGKNKIVRYEYTSDIEASGNIYRNSRLIASKKGDNGKIKIENERFENSNISIMPSDQILLNSIIINDGKDTILLEGTFKNCNLNVKKTHLVTVGTTKLYDCKIENSEIFIQRLAYIENSIFNNSIIRSTTNTEVLKVNKSNFENSSIKISTWGTPTEITVENSNVNVENSAFVDISAGKMKNLILKNNIINNNSSIQTLDMFDTHYSTPNANVLLENNIFNQTKNSYVFDGKDIDSGVFYFSEKNNTINGAKILNPKYINNQYFKITN